MTRPLLLSFLLAAPLAAGETTVETAPFRVEKSFTARVLPAEATGFSLDPESWESFVVASITDHGSTVKQDDALVSFEPEAYERQLEDARRDLALKELEVAEQSLNVEKYEDELALQLEAAEREKRQADEDLAYFKNTGRPASETSVEQRVASSEFSLKAAEEELKQLKMMYDADDVTEDTEEIILERQRFSVESAEHNLSEAKRRAQHTLETELPRQLASLEQAAETAAIKLAKTENNTPRQLKRAKLELEKARAERDRQKLEVERLERDGELLERTAPADGTFVHGGFEDGEWSAGDVAKHLRVGATVPRHRTLVSVIPADSAPAVAARVDPADARALAPDTPATFTLPGRGDLTVTGKVATVDPVPGLDGKHRVGFDATWPEDAAIPWLAELKGVAVPYQNPEAVHVPEKALHPAAEGGWTVEVKLADGKTEHRAVTRGRSNGEATEILSGLEAGQVVVTPE